MKPKSRKHKAQQRQWDETTQFVMNDPAARERLIDALAMHLCPTQEWRSYEKKTQALIWQSRHQKNPNKAKLYTFPVWRKYRSQAQKIVNLHQVVPILRHLPLPVSSFLGEVFF